MRIPLAAQWISFSPIIPWGWLVALMALVVALVVWYYRRWRVVLLKNTWRWLVAAKATSVAVVTLVLLNPSWHMTVPDDRKFTVVCLNDASASMGVADCDGNTRLAVAKKLVGPEGPAGKALGRFENVRRFVFSEGAPMRVSSIADLALQRGRTDVDGSIDYVFERLGAERLGAVLLVTDGIDNVGEPLLSRVRALAETGVPINCIGVGDPRPGQDVAIAFDAPPAKIRKGKPFRLRAKVSANLSEARELNVDLYDGPRRIRQKTVRVGGDEKTAELSFDLTSVLTGLRAYKIQVEQLPNEFNIFNNTDFVGVEVLPPDQYNCLYVSYSPSWDLKFLRALAQREAKLQLSGVVQLSKDNWYRFGFEEDPPEGLPGDAQLNDYDCVFLDLTGAAAMTEDEWRRISEFVQRRGGGVIFLGLPTELPEDFGTIPPFTVSRPPWTRLGYTPITVSRTSLLMDADGGNESLLGSGLFVPADAPFAQIRKAELKRAATVGAIVESSDLVMVSGHAVGAGKVAFVAIPDTWKWLMRSDAGEDRFGAFWTRIVAWSTAGPKERLTVLPPSSAQPLNERLVLRTAVRTPDFVPDNGATVKAVVTLPDGTVEDVDCFNDPAVDGQYVGRFSPREPGMHRVTITVKRGDGETLESRQEYLFSERSGETSPQPMAENELQNLARLTGGRYWFYDDRDAGGELALSERIRRIEKRTPLHNFWVFLLAAVLFLVPDWYLRRRTGLR